MSKNKYKVITVNNKDTKEFEHWLNEKSKKGWDCVSVTKAGNAETSSREVVLKKNKN